MTRITAVRASTAAEEAATPCRKTRANSVRAEMNLEAFAKVGRHLSLSAVAALSDFGLRISDFRRRLALAVNRLNATPLMVVPSSGAGPIRKSGTLEQRRTWREYATRETSRPPSPGPCGVAVGG